MRAELFVRTIPTRGMPTRGSIQDRIACEMLIRDRRRTVTEHVYLARITAAGLNLPQEIFQLATSLLSMEVFQESYQPEVVKEKEYALKLIQDNVTQRHEGQVRMFNKLHKLTARESDLRPATADELEAFKRKIRQRYVKNAQQPR